MRWALRKEMAIIRHLKSYPDDYQAKEALRLLEKSLNTGLRSWYPLPNGGNRGR